MRRGPWPELMTVKEVAERLGVTRNTVANWEYRRLLVPKIRISKWHPLYTKADVRKAAEWLADPAYNEQKRNPAREALTPPTPEEIADLDRYVTTTGYGIELARRWRCSKERVRQRMVRIAYLHYFFTHNGLAKPERTT